MQITGAMRRWEFWVLHVYESICTFKYGWGTQRLITSSKFHAQVLTQNTASFKKKHVHDYNKYSKLRLRYTMELLYLISLSDAIIAKLWLQNNKFIELIVKMNTIFRGFAIQPMEYLMVFFIKIRIMRTKSHKNVIRIMIAKHTWP